MYTWNENDIVNSGLVSRLFFFHTTPLKNIITVHTTVTHVGDLRAGSALIRTYRGNKCCYKPAESCYVSRLQLLLTIHQCTGIHGSDPDRFTVYDNDLSCTVTTADHLIHIEFSCFAKSKQNFHKINSTFSAGRNRIPMSCMFRWMLTHHEYANGQNNDMLAIYSIKYLLYDHNSTYNHVDSVK